MWILTKSALFYEFYFFFLYWAPVCILAFVSAKASITFTSLNHRTIKRQSVTPRTMDILRAGMPGAKTNRKKIITAAGQQAMSFV
ncbi:hypothetical protein DXA66_10890 [Faecalibacterium sp. OF03-6AC]|nr:hypothetical protein DXA66_10890 [Faecalibacterium sp. OF03-6AC]